MPALESGFPIKSAADGGLELETVDDFVHLVTDVNQLDRLVNETFTEAGGALPWAFARLRRAWPALKQEDTGQAASSLLNMGNTRYMLGQLEDAIDAYDAALELDEEYEKALEYRGIVAGILAEEADEEAAGAEDEATEADGVDQSEEDAGRPASPDENTPSARPTP